MTARPLVSAIIPAYNAEDCIAEALASVREQTYENIEVVVCDDGSTDATAEIVQREFPEVLYVHQENAGPAVARNTAVAHASGELLATLDSDDRWTPEKIERQVAIFLAEPNVGIVATNGIVESGDRRYPWARTDGPRLREVTVADQLCRDLRPLSPSAVIRREAFEEAGGYDTSVTWGEDLDLFCRIIAMGHRFLYLNAPLYIYRRWTGAITRGHMTKYGDDILRGIEKMDPRRQHEGYTSPLTEREYSLALGERLLRLAWASFAEDSPVQMREYLDRLADLPAPDLRMRGLRRLGLRNGPLFHTLFTIERRFAQLRLYVRRWGFVRGIMEHLIRRRVGA